MEAARLKRHAFSACRIASSGKCDPDCLDHSKQKEYLAIKGSTVPAPTRMNEKVTRANE